MKLRVKIKIVSYNTMFSWDEMSHGVKCLTGWNVSQDEMSVELKCLMRWNVSQGELIHEMFCGIKCIMSKTVSPVKCLWWCSIAQGKKRLSSRLRNASSWRLTHLWKRFTRTNISKDGKFLSQQCQKCLLVWNVTRLKCLMSEKRLSRNEIYVTKRPLEHKY